jgi:hypothetical protein
LSICYVAKSLSVNFEMLIFALSANQLVVINIEFMPEEVIVST